MGDFEMRRIVLADASALLLSTAANADILTSNVATINFGDVALNSPPPGFTIGVISFEGLAR
jgi:hypothetical protein